MTDSNDINSIKTLINRETGISLALMIAVAAAVGAGGAWVGRKTTADNQRDSDLQDLTVAVKENTDAIRNLIVNQPDVLAPEEITEMILSASMDRWTGAMMAEWAQWYLIHDPNARIPDPRDPSHLLRKGPVPHGP
jgi:hypothetical protein